MKGFLFLPVTPALRFAHLRLRAVQVLQGSVLPLKQSPPDLGLASLPLVARNDIA